MPADDKLVQDVLEYLSELGEELPGLDGLWGHPLAVATCIDSRMDPSRIRRLLEKMLRADLVRDCDEPLSNRMGRRGAPRRMFQITPAGLRALELLKAGRNVSFDPVYRVKRSPSLRQTANVTNGTSTGGRGPVDGPAAIPPGVNPFQVLYEAVEDYLEFAEPEMSEEYRNLEKAAALVRRHREIANQ